MQSHEVLRQAIDRVGVKSLAGTLRLSPALVYKWCNEHDPLDPDSSGARNPLDRVAEIARITGDDAVVRWLCRQVNGFFVANPPADHHPIDTQLLLNTRQLVTEFSQLLITVTKSIEDDGAIQPHEAQRIREAWDIFKSTVEAFTIACEQGRFALKRA